MRHLCFEVSSGSIRYELLNSSDQTTIQTGFLPLNARVPELKTEACSDFLRKENLLDFDGEVSLAFTGHKVTLVPQVIFGDSTAKEIFALCFGNSDDHIEHNRFFEQALVVVYEIEAWIKRFFVIRYPRITIQHEVTHVLRGIFTQPNFEPKIHVIADELFFTLILTAKNKIIFFNTFDFSNADDIFYYATHAWFNSINKDKKIELLWHTNIESDAMFEQIKLNFSKQFKPTQFNLQTISKIKHQLLCV